MAQRGIATPLAFSFALGAAALMACANANDGNRTPNSSPTTLSIDDPLYAAPTQTTAEWVTDDAYTCRNERSACALPCSSSDLWVAINEGDFRGSATCGACMQVSSPKGLVVVEVIENCAGACAAGEIELSQGAFERIGELAEGRAPVSWQLVPCDRQGPIAFAYEADSDEWWAGIQVRNSRLPIAGLSIRVSDDGWIAMTRDGWNHFPISADLGAGPFDFRVTAIDGQELVESSIPFVPGGVVAGQGQFQ